MKLALRVGRYISRNFCSTALFPPPSATVMTVKKLAIPEKCQQVGLSKRSGYLIPTGAKTN